EVDVAQQYRAETGAGRRALEGSGSSAWSLGAARHRRADELRCGVGEEWRSRPRRWTRAASNSQGPVGGRAPRMAEERTRRPPPPDPAGSTRSAGASAEAAAAGSGHVAPDPASTLRMERRDRLVTSGAIG